MDIGESSFNFIINNLNTAIYITNLDRVITHWNKNAETITGFKYEEVVGTKCSDNILNHINESGESLCLGSCPLSASMVDHQKRSANVYLHHKKGHRVKVNVVTTPLYNDHGEVVGGIELFNPIEISSNLKHPISLLEKSCFNEKLKTIFKEHNATDFSIIRIFIDGLDSIKKQHGELIAEQLYTLVTNNILSFSKENDLYGAWNENEIIGIISETKLNELLQICDLFKMTTLTSYINTHHHLIKTTISIGGTMYRKGDYLLDILERLDNNIYKCKTNGGNIIFID